MPDNFKSAGVEGSRSGIKKPWEMSIDEGKATGNWLESVVISVQEGCTDKCENCRPINLTSLLLKSFERLLRDIINRKLKRNKLLTTHRHEFRTKRSCLPDTTDFLDELTSRLDVGKGSKSLT